MKNKKVWETKRKRWGRKRPKKKKQQKRREKKLKARKKKQKQNKSTPHRAKQLKCKKKKTRKLYICWWFHLPLPEIKLHYKIISFQTITQISFGD